MYAPRTQGPFVRTPNERPPAPQKNENENENKKPEAEFSFELDAYSGGEAAELRLIRTEYYLWYTDRLGKDQYNKENSLVQKWIIRPEYTETHQEAYDRVHAKALDRMLSMVEAEDSRQEFIRIAEEKGHKHNG